MFLTLNVNIELIMCGYFSYKFLRFGVVIVKIKQISIVAYFSETGKIKVLFLAKYK